MSQNYVFVPTRDILVLPCENLPTFDALTHLWCTSNVTSAYDMVLPQLFTLWCYPLLQWISLILINDSCWGGHDKCFVPFCGLTFDSNGSDMCTLLLLLSPFCHIKVNGVSQVFIFTLWRKIFYIFFINKVFHIFNFKFSEGWDWY